jgi:hypothetical protein
MARTSEVTARDTKIAELKRLISANAYETLEKLEDAVDAFLCGEQDRLQSEHDAELNDIARSFPK